MHSQKRNKIIIFNHIIESASYSNDLTTSKTLSEYIRQN